MINMGKSGWWYPFGRYLCCNSFNVAEIGQKLQIPVIIMSFVY